MAEDNEDEGENKNCDNKNKIKIESLKVMRTIGTGDIFRGVWAYFEVKFSWYFKIFKRGLKSDFVFSFMTTL